MTAQTKNGTLALWFILAGLFGIWASATNGIRHWPDLTFMLKVCDAVFAVSGLLLLAAGAWLSLMGTKRRTAALVGALSAGVFVIALAAGIWSGVIPCSSPG